MANINDIIRIIKDSSSWDEFKAKVIDISPDKIHNIGLKVDKEQLPDDLSEFNKKLKQGLNWNPKD